VSGQKRQPFRCKKRPAALSNRLLKESVLWKAHKISCIFASQQLEINRILRQQLAGTFDLPQCPLA
jgi:hypothetical protein